MGDSNRKNVIVVGAGASKEFGLPTGVELTQQIQEVADIRFDSLGAKLISGDYDIVEVLQALVHSDNGINKSIREYLFEAWAIRDNMGLAPSIDNFLDTHRENEKLVRFGKLAIAHSILEAERSSTLYIDTKNSNNKINYSNISNTWLARYFQILVMQRNFRQFIEAIRNITFISFNYDRCIHQYFANASKSYFRASDEQIGELLEELDVVYPYGSLGDLEWNGEKTIGFGVRATSDKLLKISNGINTFTEGVDSDFTVPRIHNSLNDGEVLIFLGFSFLPLNMELLTRRNTYPNFERILATGRGLSRDSQNIIADELVSKFTAGEPHKLSMIDGTCADLFFEYQRYLMS